MLDVLLWIVVALVVWVVGGMALGVLLLAIMRTVETVANAAAWVFSLCGKLTRAACVLLRGARGR
jgi:hypothetical protein